ncbi:6641_t:CDS:2 [Ambispora gerdemannii]|uniref:6641_t:CDS:1 n=1 Tax=Ambispora gerdemannii TaxID=144530 RepID=A0A9N9BQ61_9GLOM|nr:6641_t:CDS:2 [Ambispora gerdemannii]
MSTTTSPTTASPPPPPTTATSAAIPSTTTATTTSKKPRRVEILPVESDKLKHSFAGAIAGCVSSIVTCPLDVVKTRLQNQNSYLAKGIYNSNHIRGSAGPLYKGTGGTLRRIWREEGIRGLYRGLGPTLYGYLPTWAIYFSAYDYFKLALAEEGIRGFYKGLGPSLMGVSHVAVQFPLYEKMKIWLKSPDHDHLSNLSILYASSASKMVASMATYPHEVVRTRLQNQTVQPHKYHGVIHAVRVISHEEGWTAFYKGMMTNLLRTVPASALTILTYEILVRRLNTESQGG